MTVKIKTVTANGRDSPVATTGNVTLTHRHLVSHIVLFSLNSLWRNSFCETFFFGVTLLLSKDEHSKKHTWLLPTVSELHASLFKGREVHFKNTSQTNKHSNTIVSGTLYARSFGAFVWRTARLRALQGGIIWIPWQNVKCCGCLYPNRSFWQYLRFSRSKILLEAECAVSDGPESCWGIRPGKTGKKNSGKPGPAGQPFGGYMLELWRESNEDC